MQSLFSEKLLELIEEKLEKQSQAEKMTQEKLTEWIKTLVRKIGDKKRADKLTEEKKAGPTMYV